MNNQKHPYRKDILVFKIHRLLTRYRTGVLSFLFGLLVGRLINELSNPEARSLGDLLSNMLAVKEKPLNLTSWFLLILIVGLPVAQHVFRRLVDSHRYQNLVQSALSRLRSSSLDKYPNYLVVQEALTLQRCPHLDTGWTAAEVSIHHSAYYFLIPAEHATDYTSFRSGLSGEDGIKIMLSKNPISFTDSPRLILETQLTRFSVVQFYRNLTQASPVLRDQLAETLLRDLTVTFPHSLCLELVVTRDDRLLRTKRSPKVTYDPGKWSCSIAEQMASVDISEGATEGVVAHWLSRTLKEELGLYLSRDYDVANFRILSVFLESDIMNVSLCGIVRLDVDHRALAAILNPIVNAPRRKDDEFTAFDFVDWKDAYRDLRSATAAATYYTTSRYKMLMAALNRFGDAAVAAEAVGDAESLLGDSPN